MEEIKMSYETKSYRCRAYLFCIYELLEIPSPKIAKECRVNKSTIMYWLRKFNIRIRPRSERTKKR